MKVMVIVKATKNSEAGIMHDPQLRRARASWWAERGCFRAHAASA